MIFTALIFNINFLALPVWEESEVYPLADFPIQVPRGFGTSLSRELSYLNREIPAIFPYHSQLFK